MIAQMEIGESGTVHYQGYVQLGHSARMTQLKKWLPTAHWERMRGTATEAQAYCMKEDSRLEAPIEWGQFCLGQGARTDLLGVKRQLDEGRTLAELARSEDCFATVLRHIRPLQWYVNTKEVQYQTPKRIIVICGPTNTGKTTYAKSLGTYYALDPEDSWFDMYMGEEIVLFDEFIGKSMPMERFNMLWDGTRTMMKTKGGFVKVTAHTFVFTSNVHPESWWPNAYFEAFKRRVSEWIVIRRQGLIEKTQDYTRFTRTLNGDIPLPADRNAGEGGYNSEAYNTEGEEEESDYEEGQML